MRFKPTVILLGFLFALAVCVPVQVLAQTIVKNDDTTLKQIIIFGRHSIRSSTMSPSQLAHYAVDPYPPFGVAAGCLTANGSKAENLLGAYFRQYLLNEGLLTGNAQTDASNSYFRANSIERSVLTAEAFQSALIPKSPLAVHSYALNTADPVFDPIWANVATVDPNVAAEQVQEIFNSGEALKSAYSGEYSLIHNALFDEPSLEQPPVCVAMPCIDPTAQTISLSANTETPMHSGAIINIGGLAKTNDAADPFVMQYADGFPLGQVAWGRLTLDQVSQQSRIIGFKFEIEGRSPYLAKVQSSNAAQHILRTMQQAATGKDIAGAFGDAKTRIAVVISSDTYVAGLAGLLGIHWQLPGYQPDFCAPGGALVFELRETKSKEYLVRVFYTAQTWDQLRNLTSLSQEKPPATIQLLVPGGSKSATDFDVDFTTFSELVTNAIDPADVEEQASPPVITGVTCQ
jgi:4-phytase/acid phosphatase